MLRKTKRTKVNRGRKKACYDPEKIHETIDAAIIGHMAFKLNDDVHSIPLPFWRDGDAIFCHCSVNSRLALLAGRGDVCVSFVIIDGWVLAKSALHHSMNYRSAVVYGQLELLADNDSKNRLLELFMHKIDVNRWNEVRQPSQKELNAIVVLKLPLTEAVVKFREGFPEDKKSDLKRDVWAGVIPITHKRGKAIRIPE